MVKLTNESDPDDSFFDDSVLDFPEFSMGLTKQNCEKVRLVRNEFLNREAEKLTPQIQEQIANEIKKEWSSVLTPEIVNKTFDFNVLKSLINDTSKNFTYDDKNYLKKENLKLDDWEYE